MNARRLLPLLLITALLAGAAADAQTFPFRTDAPDSRIGCDLSLGVVQVRDDLLARIRHGGPGGKLRLWCDLAGRDNLHTIRLGGGAAVVANRFDIEALAASIELAYGFGVKVPAWSDDHLAVYLGGMLSAANDIQFYQTIDEAHIYWLTMHDLRLHGTLHARVGEGSRIVAELGIPVVALVSRPEEYRYYNNDMPDAGDIFSTVHEALKVETLDRFQAADLRVGYEFPLSERLSESVSYAMRFRRSTDPALHLSLEHALQLSLGYSL